MSDQDQNEIQNDEAPQNEYQPEQSNKQVLIRLSDMPQQDECTVVSYANASIEEVADLPGIPEAQKYSKIAGILKRELDNKLGEGWYVICGRNFGTFVTHQYGTFIHFSFDQLHFCCFKAQ